MAVDEVHGGGLGIHQVGADREVVLLGPLLAAEQHSGGAIGKRSGVTGGHGGLGAVRLGVLLAEYRLQLRELLGAGIRAHIVVAGDPEEGGDEIVEEAAVVGGGEVLVARGGEGILILAGDAHLARGDGGVVAHRQAGARLGVARLLRDETRGADLAEQLDAVEGRLRRGDLDESLTQVVAHGERSIGGGVRTAGNAAVNAAHGDRVGHLDCRGQAGATCLLQVERGGRRIEHGTDDGFADEVEVAGVLEHGTGDHHAELFILQVVTGREAVDRGRQHVLVGSIGVLAVRASERDAVATDDGDLARRSIGHVLLNLQCGSRAMNSPTLPGSVAAALRSTEVGRGGSRIEYLGVIVTHE